MSQRIQLPHSYYHGRKARIDAQRKVAPGHYSFEQAHWWLAGWNDADMEL